jgi:plastocyanin
VRIIRSKKLWASAAATGAAGALGLALVAPAAPAEEAQRGSTSTIAMVQDGDELFFEGPATINPGANLRIVNTTDPQQIGPHTFSLTKQNLIPSSAKEAKACGKLEKDTVCDNIAKAHEVNLQNGKVGRKFVDSGKEGWNLLFRDQGQKGDSWYTEEQDDEKPEVVAARPGKTLSYFCVIHPQMQGEIQVNNPTK